MRNFFWFLIPVFFFSCKNHKQVDAIFYNGKVYTIDSSFSTCEAFAVKDGRIIFTGTNEQVKEYEALNKTDLKGKFVYPGFYDAHCHFYNYGLGLKKINLYNTNSFDEIKDTLLKYRDNRFMGWVYGQGWDQNDWPVQKYPDRQFLDSLFPDVPVLLFRVDGHAALANKKALDIAGITVKTKIQGGEVEVINGRLTGILIDNAKDSVKVKIPLPHAEAETEALLEAQKNCFKVGLTTIADAGLEKETILLIDSLQKAHLLKMGYYAMVTWNMKNKEYFFKNGKIDNGSLHVCSFKLYADGALGSRGACLLKPYTDMPNHRGFLLNPVDSLMKAAEEIAVSGFQMNTHCIGDSGVRLMLNIYGKALAGKSDARWRIEHCQVVDPDDLKLFKNYGVIPSVQPTHATSDMYWAEERLGPERIKTAYAYLQLIESAGLVANGSDFPVEDINPLYGYYAAVVRRDKKNFPADRFQPENALTREDALRGMTIWAAYSCFEEKQKGSLEVGKQADFVILEDDLLSAPEEKLWQIKVKNTFIKGELVY
jgi:predicted amidohydrolase YtcJ